MKLKAGRAVIETNDKYETGQERILPAGDIYIL